MPPKSRPNNFVLGFVKNGRVAVWDSEPISDPDDLGLISARLNKDCNLPFAADAESVVVARVAREGYSTDVDLLSIRVLSVEPVSQPRFRAVSA